MQFIFSATDKSNSLQIRMDNRPNHVDFLKSSEDFGVKLILAGPTLDDNDAMCGSVLILEADSAYIVKSWLEKDPYNTAELFESSNLKAMKIAIKS